MNGRRDNRYLYVGLGILIGAIVFSVIQVVRAVTPNPGHPWTEVGDGIWAATGMTSLRTFTFPDQNANIVTATTTLTGLLKGFGTNVVTTVSAPAGAIVGDADIQTLTNKTLTGPQINGLDLQRTTITGNTTLSSSTHTVVLADATSAAFTITLPTAVGIDGFVFVIKKIDAALANLVTINTTSGQTIDGMSTISLSQRGESAILQSDGSNWRILSRRDYDISAYKVRGATLNQWYSSPSNGTAYSTATLTANRLYAMPFVVSKVMSIDQMQINVTTLSATATTTQVGIYNDNGNDYPGALVVDAGAQSGTTAGVKTYLTGLPVTLDPGLYWLVVDSQGTPVIRGFAVAGLTQILGMANGLGTTPNLGWWVAQTAGALPATYPAGGTAATAVPLPAVFVRLSS